MLLTLTVCELTDADWFSKLITTLFLTETSTLLSLITVDTLDFFVSIEMNYGGDGSSAYATNVKKALVIGIKAKKHVMTEAIPFCLMTGYEPYIAEKIIPLTKIIDQNFIIEDYAQSRTADGKAKGPPCQQCKYGHLCEGPWKEYPKLFGWGEFKGM